MLRERDKCWMIDGKETKKDLDESGGKRGEVGEGGMTQEEM